MGAKNFETLPTSPTVSLQFQQNFIINMLVKGNIVCVTSSDDLPNCKNFMALWNISEHMTIWAW